MDQLGVRELPSIQPMGPGPRQGLSEVLRPTIWRLAVIGMLLSYAWAVPAFVGHHPSPHWPALLSPSLIGVAAALSIRLSPRYWASTVVFVAGLSMAALAEAALGHEMTAGWLALCAAMVAGLASGPQRATTAALVLIVLALVVPVPLAQRLALVRGAALGTVLIWAAGSSIFEALIRGEESERRSWEHAREAMQRCGELQQTSKALRDMYAALERTNRELEIARREAEEAKETKARFAANISHELRTPLNVIMGFSRVMYQTPEVYGDLTWPAELRLDIHEVYRASRHLLGMIDDILDLSRIEARRMPLRLERTDLTDVLAGAVATARGLLRGRPVELVVNVPADLPHVDTDPTRIRQVLLNLLNNAIRFTDSGYIALSAAVRGGEVEIAVRDSGVGIAPADLSRVFEEFSQAGGPITAGRGGAGLGLAVCRQFVHLHGGRISAESKVGQGSTFRFTLPLPKEGKARSRLAYHSPEGWLPPLPKDRLGRSVVILASDETTARMVARGIEGYRTIIVTGMESLRETVEAEHPAGLIVVKDPLEPDASPTPEELWEAAGRLDLGVVEYEWPNESLVRRLLGADGYLAKPVATERLVKAIAPDGSAPSRVLVVDDDPAFRTLMQRTLLVACPTARLSFCPSGDEAMRLLSRERYDVVLLDLVMPGELGGVELLRRARESALLEGTRVIVVSGAAYAEELAVIYPARLHFSKKALPRGNEWFRCIRALLDSAPPDYSRPAASATSSASPPALVAS